MDGAIGSPERRFEELFARAQQISPQQVREEIIGYIVGASELFSKFEAASREGLSRRQTIYYTHKPYREFEIAIGRYYLALGMMGYQNKVAPEQLVRANQIDNAVIKILSKHLTVGMIRLYTFETTKTGVCRFLPKSIRGKILGRLAARRMERAKLPGIPLKAAEYQ